MRYSTINDESKYKSKDHLFMFKTTIMVNKRKTNLLYNFYFRQTAVFFLYFFIFNPSILLFSSFCSTFFVLVLSYLNGRCTFFFANISGRNFSLFFWTFLSGTFFPGRGVHVHPPSLRTRLRNMIYLAALG